MSLGSCSRHAVYDANEEHIQRLEMRILVQSAQIARTILDLGVSPVSTCLR